MAEHEYFTDPAAKQSQTTGDLISACTERDEFDGLDMVSVSDASKLLSKSRKTLRREMQRSKKRSIPIEADVTLQSGQDQKPCFRDQETQKRAILVEADVSLSSHDQNRCVRDQGTQCDIGSNAAVEHLRKALNSEKLKSLVLRGKIADLRRRMGLPSESSGSEACEDNGSSPECSHSVEDPFENELSRDNVVYDTEEASTFIETLEIGDIAMISGLNSEKGKDLNGRYGRLTTYDHDKDRYGVRLQDGSVLSIKRDNLKVGMKRQAVTQEDEELVLGLRPTPESVRKLPYKERMQAIYGKSVMQDPI